MRSVRAAAFSSLLVAALTACALPVKPSTAPAERAPESFPEEFYLRTAARGEPVYRVDAQRSQIIVYAYRGGQLARVGHDHVISSRELRGYIHLPPNPSTGSADLYLALDSLQADEPVLRAQAGFTTEPSPADVAATRRNMLEKVLEAAQHPFVVLHIGELRDGPTAPVLSGEMTLHGVTRTLRLPVEIERTGDALAVDGGFSLRQSDFGIKPFSVLGGALKVEDQLDVRFRVLAARLLPAVEPAAVR
jgi:polyisoprenoid-binding protein YceI